MKYADMGIEFAGAVGGFTLLGYWIDRHWQIEGHRGLLICAVLGLIGGTYNMVRRALQASRDMTHPIAHRKDDDESPPRR